ncbi:hypothetical protein KS4_24360 [Poriferisphaera corsica]|uniref:Uncharacterized protein n=1 Tax=Poriferisphaera corsica TaxID=2528020 RepID=A0A517YVW3_9BACT|nr:hypothetical protein [Poriferisphaera corsica]QDU34368.1 hypothetical protein KS4_24360 [Poriferisphaera corsica]
MIRVLLNIAGWGAMFAMVIVLGLVELSAIADDVDENMDVMDTHKPEQVQEEQEQSEIWTIGGMRVAGSTSLAYLGKS